MKITKDGFDFSFNPNECSNCNGNCCIGESGYIWINPDEIEKLAKFLDISVEELKEKFLFKAKYKYSIREKKVSEDNFACAFFDLDKKMCMIYDLRPTQCRTFPFWDYFRKKPNEVKEECPAIEII
jgi:Fe-S-cluster containining protein